MTTTPKKDPAVFFYEAFEEEQEELKKYIGNDFSCSFSTKTIQELKHLKPPAPIISIRTQSQIPAAWSTQLKGVLSRSTGYDHLIAYRAEVKEHIPLGFLDEYATRAVAEQALLLSLALMRKLTLQTEQFKAFERDGLTGSECPSRNLLVVGVGRIGSEIYRIAQALGFKVKGVDLVQNRKNVEYVSKEAGMPWADVIVCAMNLTNENRGYFDHKLLKGAKQGALFVNIARGEHSPLRDLTRLLREKRLGGVALDVYEDEGTLGAALRSHSRKQAAAVTELKRLATFPNVILTPHNAFNTIEAVERKSRMSVEQIKHFLKTGDFLWKLS